MIVFMNFGNGFLLTKSNQTGKVDIYFQRNQCPEHYFILSETEEEKTVRESIQVWYGINRSVLHYSSFSTLISAIALHLLFY